MTVIYPNLCYNEVCYKGTAMNKQIHEILVVITYMSRACANVQSP